METLVVLHHRNQYHSRVKPHGPARFRSFSSRNFTGINCRTFHGDIRLKSGALSSPIPISDEITKDEKPFNEEFPIETRSFLYSELWAGPAYSNSPPPSSLPMPKFSLRQKRSVSLDSTASKPIMEMHKMPKSAPASPTGEHEFSAREPFLIADSATKTLRRILNLDDADE